MREVQSPGESMMGVGHPAGDKLAVQIWQAEGCQAGKDLEYRLRAEIIKQQLGEEIQRAVERSRLKPQIILRERQIAQALR